MEIKNEVEIIFTDFYLLEKKFRFENPGFISSV